MFFKKKHKPIEYDRDKADLIAHAVDSQFMKNPEDEEAHDKNFMTVANMAKVLERVKEMEKEIGIQK